MKTATIVFKNNNNSAIADSVVGGQGLGLEKQDAIRYSGCPEKQAPAKMAGAPSRLAEL